MLTIITPCYRQHHLPLMFNSIDFNKITEWIIVYDTTKDRLYQPIYHHPKIREVECNHAGISGNAQRNYGLSLVKDGFIYFLDDDNIIHPGFWSIVDSFELPYFYTFNQDRNNKGWILCGNKIQVQWIDTAMYIVHKKHIERVLWKLMEYKADGYFICDVLSINPYFHKYIPKTAAYYNYLD